MVLKMERCGVFSRKFTIYYVGVKKYPIEKNWERMQHYILAEVKLQPIEKKNKIS